MALKPCNTLATRALYGRSYWLFARGPFNVKRAPRLLVWAKARRRPPRQSRHPRLDPLLCRIVQTGGNMRVRTEYSFRHAAGKLPDVIKRLQTLGWGAAPIADRLGTYAFAQWAKLTAEADLRPIYGVELPVTSKLAQRNPDTDYWTFYAIKDIRALYKLIAQATANIDGLLLYAQAMQATGLVKIAGERAQLTSMRPDVPNLYMALSPATPKGLYNDAKAQGYKFIATSDNVYLTPDDREFY